MDKYVKAALDMGATNARAISSRDLVFDPRTFLKCMGCASFGAWRCPPNHPTHAEARVMLEKYTNVLLIHAHDKKALSKMAREIERQAFLDGNYFAFALAACYHCEKCKRPEEGPCVNPDGRRPHSYSLGIDIFRTVTAQGLPIRVLQSQEEEQNWYAFVLIK